MHHPPYSSGLHGNNIYMQWPYSAWGADIVISGHDHTYERINLGGIAYYVNGLGGASIYNFGPPVNGSEVRYNKMHGAMLIETMANEMILKFCNINNALIDEYAIVK